MKRRSFALAAAGLSLSAVSGTHNAFAQAGKQAAEKSSAAAGPAQPAPSPKSAGSKEADAIVRRVQKFYDSAKSFRAEFRQRYTIYAYNRTKDSRGTVVFQKPGKMRWTYTNNGNVVVSDGKQIKVFEQENRQMYLQKVDDTQYPAALSFLLGKGRLKEAFSFTKLDSKKLKFPGGYVLLGTPSTPTPAYQKVLFYIDKRTFQVRRVLLVDAQKNRNRFDFLKPRVNEPVAPKDFQYEPPAGTNVIRP